MIFIRTENVFTETYPMQNYPNNIKYRCNQQRKSNYDSKILNIKPMVNDPVSPIKIFLPRFGFPKTL